MAYAQSSEKNPSPVVPHEGLFKTRHATPADFLRFYGFTGLQLFTVVVAIFIQLGKKKIPTLLLKRGWGGRDKAQPGRVCVFSWGICAVTSESEPLGASGFFPSGRGDA